jgi:hypothetical protein
LARPFTEQDELAIIEEIHRSLSEVPPPQDDPVAVDFREIVAAIVANPNSPDHREERRRLTVWALSMKRHCDARGLSYPWERGAS